MSEQYLTRREMLRVLARLPLAAIPATGLLACGSQKEEKRVLHNNYQVAIVPCPSYDDPTLVHAINRGWQKTSPPVVKDKRVVIKPNLVEFSEDRPITTDVRLVKALARFLLEMGAREVIIAEGPGHRRDTEAVWKKAGYFDLKNEFALPLIDLNYDDLQVIKTVSYKDSLIKDLYLPKTVLSADLIISVPKMKTHHWVGVTLSMKNMIGILPGIKYGWPKNIIHWNGIEKSIVEINATIPTHYTIVDGVVGMEGDGPIMGSPKKVGALIMGDNALAVDATSARVMGLAPEKIGYLQTAHENRLGTLRAEEIILTDSCTEAFKTDFDLDPELSRLKATRR
jgi:uncharacterized protein (DUF362 family)